MRRLVHRKFTLEELRQSAAGSEGRPINGSADLTLGNYCHLLQNPGNWERLGLPVDRAFVNERLKEVRNIRNDVMHFNLVGLEPDQKQALQEFVRYLRELNRNAVGLGAKTKGSASTADPTFDRLRANGSEKPEHKSGPAGMPRRAVLFLSTSTAEAGP